MAFAKFGVGSRTREWAGVGLIPAYPMDLSPPATHQLRVMRTYRHALKTARHRVVSRHSQWLCHAWSIRCGFEEQRHQADPHVIADLLKQAEDQIIHWEFSKPYVHYLEEGGSQWQREFVPFRFADFRNAAKWGFWHHDDVFTAS